MEEIKTQEQAAKVAEKLSDSEKQTLNQRAVYMAWGLLARMVIELDAMITTGFDSKRIQIEAHQGSWESIGEGDTLVEATLSGAVKLGWITEDLEVLCKEGFKAYK